MLTIFTHPKKSFHSLINKLWNVSYICYMDHLNYFHKFSKKFSWIYKNGNPSNKKAWNYLKNYLNCFEYNIFVSIKLKNFLRIYKNGKIRVPKYNIFVFIIFSNKLPEYKRMENLSNNIAWKYSKNNLNTILFCEYIRTETRL